MVVGGLGILLTAVVLSRGGGYFVLVSGLQWDVPLAIVGLATVLAASRVGDEQAGPVMLLAAVVVGSIAWNFLVYSVKFGHSVFRLLVPVAHPTGIDFRDGLYLPGKAFSNAVSGWPPFTLWIGKAFTAVGFSTGYAIQFCILLGFAAGAVVLSASLARSALSAQDQPGANGGLAGPAELVSHVAKLPVIEHAQRLSALRVEQRRVRDAGAPREVGEVDPCGHAQVTDAKLRESQGRVFAHCGPFRSEVSRRGLLGLWGSRTGTSRVSCSSCSWISKWRSQPGSARCSPRCSR